MNPFTKYLQDLGTLVQIVIIVALMVVLCALGLVVLVIAFVVVISIGVVSNPKDRTLSINPIGTIGVAVVTFGVSFAATYFAAVFTALLGVLFGAGGSESILLVWIAVFLFMVIEFLLLGAAGMVLSVFAARFHVVHALAAAGLYLGIWHVYNWWSGPSPVTLPVWVDYVEYGSVVCGAVLGSVVGERELPNYSETSDQLRIDKKQIQAKSTGV